VLRDAYDDNYYGEQESKFIKPIEIIIDWFRSQRARYAVGLIKAGDSVLDVGCGNGLFLKYLGQLGSFHLHGIEPPGKSYSRASRLTGLKIKKGFLGAGDFPPQSLSLVTMFHVLEHVPNAWETMQTLAIFLKPGGHLIVSFPNIDSWQARLSRGQWLHLDPPRHLWFPAPKQFAKWVSLFGFEVVATRHFSLEQNIFGFIQSCFNLLSLPRDLLYERLKGNQAYAPAHKTLSTFSQIAAAAALTPLAFIFELASTLFASSATIEFTLKRK
jgi:SAM-dependent methyltransferase